MAPVPAAIFTMRRSAPAAPTEIVFAWLGTELCPRATLLSELAFARLPSAVAPEPDAVVRRPTAVDAVQLAVETGLTAVAPSAEVVEVAPNATQRCQRWVISTSLHMLAASTSP